MLWAAIIFDILVAAAAGMLVRQIARSYQGHIILRPTGPRGEPWTIHLTRLSVGAVSGIVVAMVKVKYFGDDSEFVARLLNRDLFWLVGKFIGYAFAPMFLGAVGGWISDETKVHKIFWVAISAPVILAAAAGGNIGGSEKAPETLPIGKAGWNFEQFLPITPAYADEATTKPIEIAQAENPFISGLKEFFGGGPGSQRYRVVIASISDYEEAVTTAAKLNSMKILPAPAAVAERKFGNPYFPIVVDGVLTLSDAKQLRDKVSALNLGLPDPPYISTRDY
jgi:hypothetical protein